MLTVSETTIFKLFGDKLQLRVAGSRFLEYYKTLSYTIILERHDDQGIYWVARIAELPHCLTHSDTPEGAVKEIEEVKLDWIQSNLEDGLPVPEPTSTKYSGEIRVRMPPSLHQLLAQRASNEGVSLNQYMVAGLARSVGLDDPKKEQTACRK
jgi:antitoxin HicB